MELILNWGSQPHDKRPRTVFTIGVFDGLHLGHQALVRLVIQKADQLKAKSLVLTFEPHPLLVLAKNAAPPILTTVNQKADILAGLGLDCLGILRFTREMAATGPLKFLNHYLGRFLEPAAAVLGPDFTFGKDAKGDAETIKAWLKGLRSKADIIQLDALEGGNGALSSSKIRQDIKEGLVENAAFDLGRAYRLSGTVIHGQARGRIMGFPTANLGQVDQIIPAPGVYAVRAQCLGRTWPGLTSIGSNPTFGEKTQTVETHILNFDRYIYGQHLAVDFAARLRPVVRFNSIEDLVQQMQQDRENARRILRLDS